MIKQYHAHDPDRYGRVGDIEHRAEKLKPFPAYPRHPVGPVKTKQREIEHIDYPAVKQTGIPLARHKRGHGRRERVVEQQPIEQAVYDIPGRPGDNERQTDHEAGGHVGLVFDPNQNPYQNRHRNYAEQG